MRRPRITLRQLLMAVVAIAIALSVGQGILGGIEYMSYSDSTRHFRDRTALGPSANPSASAWDAEMGHTQQRKADAALTRAIPLMALTFLLFAGAMAWWARLILIGRRRSDPFAGRYDRGLAAAFKVLVIGYGIGVIGLGALYLFTLATLYDD